MNHLTDERLSALLDDALPAGERAAADAHLAGCDACRARLAELSSLDESVGRALTDDPGDAYFADFAERVERRIAAGEKPASNRQSFWGWFTSPRGLAFAGSTAALVLTADSRGCDSTTRMA
jgi:anti-sigma factor RsiW